MKSFVLKLGLLIVAFIVPALSARACGIAWNVPKNHFDGINEQGEFSYWREIGQIEFGNDLKLPLIIGFKPNRGVNSILGRGWIVPVLESNIVQIDERKFLLTQPDGLTRKFGRKTPTDSILDGQGGWKGEIRGNSIGLWAECGWKLAFTKGKITSITTPKNRVLNILYRDGKPSEIQEQGATALKVERDSLSGRICGLSFGTKRVGIELGDRPRIEMIQGMNAIGGREPSLHQLTFGDTPQTIFDFEVDEKIQPTLKISGDAPRFFTWNAATSGLLKDGEWSYYSKPAKDRWANAEIVRINEKKQRETWHRDDAHAQETTQSVNGVKRVKTWFASGLVEGKVRSITETWPSGEKSGAEFFYDENARLVRKRSVNRMGWLSLEAFQPDGSSTVRELKNGQEKSIYYKNKEGMIYASQTK